MLGDDRPKNLQKAVFWFEKAAHQGHSIAQNNLGALYYSGNGVTKDLKKAVIWFEKAAKQNNPSAQNNLGDILLALRKPWLSAQWSQRAAIQGEAKSPVRLAQLWESGQGLRQNFRNAAFWYLIAAANKSNLKVASELRERASRAAKKLTSNAKNNLKKTVARWQQNIPPLVKASEQKKKHRKIITGSGFLINADGYILTAYHVIRQCQTLGVKNTKIDMTPRLIASDPINDLALLKIPPVKVSIPPMAGRNTTNQGDTVVAIGYPLQGYLAAQMNVTTGTISALAGPQNDARLMQLTAPIQVGNSGGPVLNEFGDVVGIVVSKLKADTILKITGDTPQNINFAIKLQMLEAFLEAHEISYKKAEARSSKRPMKTADIAKAARTYTVAVTCFQ